MNVLKSFTNPKTNMQSQVRVKRDGRFAVALIDLDSGREVPYQRVWTSEDLASDYARWAVDYELRL
jgi:hypothetical protein